MLDNENIRKIIVQGLSNYLQVPVIRANQNAPPPDFPYLTYSVITLKNESKGTWGKYPDGSARMPCFQTWSFTAVSDKDAESICTAEKAREWLEYTGRQYLKQNNVTLHKAASINNRDSVISIDYEYKNGFDAVFAFLDKAEKSDEETTEYIETVKIDCNGTEVNINAVK